MSRSTVVFLDRSALKVIVKSDWVLTLMIKLLSWPGLWLRFFDWASSSTSSYSSNLRYSTQINALDLACFCAFLQFRESWR